MKPSLQFFLNRAWQRNGFDLNVVTLDHEGFPRTVGCPVMWREVTESTTIYHDAVAPTLGINLADAQALMDELWREGIRPSGSRDISDLIATHKQHTDDLRKIAFTLLDHTVGTTVHPG